MRLAYISATSVHLAQCWQCLRSGKATLLGPYSVFTTACHYADRLRAITALSRRHRTQRSHHVSGHHSIVTLSWNCLDAITTPSRPKLNRPTYFSMSLPALYPPPALRHPYFSSAFHSSHPHPACPFCLRAQTSAFLLPYLLVIILNAD